MADATTTIVLVPRFTMLAGVFTFKCAAVHVRAFGKALMTLWRGGGVGADSVTFRVEVSPDLEHWEQIASVVADDDVEERLHFDFAAEWMRITMQVVGTEPTVCTWAISQFTKRVGV